MPLEASGIGKYCVGEGPVPCRLMFIGEGPGKEEARVGRPFIGKAGRMLEMLCRRMLSLDRSEVYITNLVKRLPEGNGEPTDAMIKEYEHDLIGEIAAVDPVVICCLGRWATRWILGDVDMEVVHGLPVYAAVPGIAGKGPGAAGGNKKARIILPAFHPAAGLHNTELQGTIAWDFGQLRLLLDGKLEPGMPEDGYPEPDYREARTYFNPGPLVAVDTEGWRENPWGLSVTGHAGTATVNQTGIVGLGGKNTKIILHNSMHDLGVLRAMGIDLDDDQFEDTMVMAYLLCVEPQGLKPLARRHSGMEMQSYEEVVGPASYRLAVDYLYKAYQCLDSQSSSESSASSRTPGTKGRTRESAGKKSAKTSRKK